jgi:membrane-bound ClpP family serine protease
MDALEFMLYMGIPAAVCLIAGLALMIYEMFTPGFAVPGALGIVLLILSVILTAESFAQALMMSLVILVILTVAFIIVLLSATKGALSRSPLVNKQRFSREDGYLSVQDMDYFVGHHGVATTVLRPTGTGDFDGVKLDVVTEGEFIERGTEITVVRVEGRRIVVRALCETTV